MEIIIENKKIQLGSDIISKLYNQFFFFNFMWLWKLNFFIKYAVIISENYTKYPMCLVCVDNKAVSLSLPFRKGRKLELVQYKGLWSDLNLNQRKESMSISRIVFKPLYGLTLHNVPTWEKDALVGFESKLLERFRKGFNMFSLKERNYERID